MRNFYPAPKPSDPRLHDLTGKRFGRLVITDFAGRQGALKRPVWSARCDCGSEILVLGKSVREGNTTSCGCFHAEVFGSITRKHGEHGTTEYKTWCAMRQRCNDPNHKDYGYYGGRGISVCDRWDSFENFLADMGRRPSAGHSIDRIDVNGNYEPDNCRWATKTEQANNKRPTRREPSIPREIAA